MANATPADARAGFEIFRASGGTASLDEINAALKRAKHGEIHDRSVRHYANLLRAGYDRYVSVNRFDVASASRAYENSSALGRYQYLPSQAGVRMTFARDGDLMEVIGATERLGDVGAQLVFDNPGDAIGLAKAKLHSNQMVRLDFLDPARSTAARVIEIEIAGDRASVEVEFSRLQSVVDYTGRDPLPTERFEFRLVPTDDDDQAADLVGRRIYYFLELVEASRSLVNEYLESNDSEQFATPAAIASLRVESPAVFALVVPSAVAWIVGSCTPLIALYIYAQHARLKKGKADDQKENVRQKKIANDVDEAKAEFQKNIYKRLGGMLEDNEADPKQTKRLDQLFERELVRTVASLATQEVKAIEGGPAGELPTGSDDDDRK